MASPIWQYVVAQKAQSHSRNITKKRKWGLLIGGQSGRLWDISAGFLRMLGVNP